MIISWMSGGVTSAVACKIAQNLYENVQPYFIETGGHHPDMPRFIKDCEKWYGTKVKVLQDKRFTDHMDLCEKLKVVNFISGAECSRTLKKRVRQKFQKTTEFDGQIFGFEFEKKQINRAVRFEEQNPETKPLFPLIEKQLNKANCMEILIREGIELPAMYGLGYSNNNCLSGDTQIITSRGAVSIKSIAGKSTLIRTSEGFELAVVKDYGLKQCYEVDIERDGMIEKITASYNHRWYFRPKRYRDELLVVPTMALQVGYKIPTAHKGSISKISDEGVKHGIVFGDGTLYNKKHKNIFSMVKLIGKKVALSKYFETDGDTIYTLPKHYKDLPSLDCSQSYLCGFIAGLMATDGCFIDGVTFSQVKNINGILAIMEAIGLSTQKIKTIKGDTNYKKDRTLNIIRIISASFPPELDILNQRKNFRSHHRADDGVVVAVRKTGNRRVYCPTTSTGDLTLKYGIITGNCIGCVKGGKGYWNNIRIDFPPAFDRMAKIERKVGRTCIKDTYLDELKPGAGRHVLPPMPECDLFCEIEFADIISPKTTEIMNESPKR